jgi:hypothetical protein
MDQFRSFGQLRTTELSITRVGLFRPWYEVTDGQFCYGKLSYVRSFKKLCTIETDQGTWILKRKAFMNRTFLLQQPEDVTIGTITPELWSRKVAISMNNGFEATFLNKKLFSRTLTLASDQYGDIISIESKLWKGKTPFLVDITPNLPQSLPALPLLILLGVHLVLQKQAEIAAVS